MMVKLIYAYLSFFSILLISACREKDCVEEYEMSTANNSLYINLNIQVNDGSGSVSRAVDESTPGTDDENKIHNLYIYLFDSKDNRLVYWADITKQNLSDDRKKYYIKLDVDLPESVRIYLAANLTEKQAESIKGPDAIYTSEKTTYTMAINEFAPYEYKLMQTPDGVRRTIGFAMTGQAFSGNSTEFDIFEYTRPDTPLRLTVNMKRVVAKVLLTVKPAEKDKISSGYLSDYNYAVISSDNDFKGWIRTNHIYYFPNGTNKKLYWFEQPNNIDPNFELDEFIISDSEDISLITEEYQKNFVYYNLVDQYKYYYAYYKTELYDDSKYESNAYTEGMYFLENTFNTETNYLEQLDKYPLALPMVTSISIALRYTPKEIYVEKGLYNALDEGTSMSTSEKNYWKEMKNRYNEGSSWENVGSWTNGFSPVVFENEADAQFVLTMSLKINKAYISSTEYGEQVIDGTYGGTRFPDNTFFAFTPNPGTSKDFLYHYYTYGARKLVDNPILYVPYVSGWAYYYTYLDGTNSNLNPAVYSSSQIKRNNYYILKLNSISHLGGSKTDPNYIHTNTTVVPWKKGGKLDVNIW